MIQVFVVVLCAVALCVTFRLRDPLLSCLAAVALGINIAALGVV